MQKRKLSLIMLIAASLIMCIVLVGGVLYAWILTNEDVTGGIRVRVTDLNDSGIDITSFNDGNVPDGGTQIFPGDKLKLGLRVTQAITDFQVGFTAGKLTDEAFFDKFGKRPDLLSGVYKKENSINGQTAPVEYDFDLDGALEEYIERTIDRLIAEGEFGPEGDEGYTDAQLAAMRARREVIAQGVRFEFLKRFTDQNSLIRAFTVKLVSIRPWGGWDDYNGSIGGQTGGKEDYYAGEDFDYEFMFTSPSVINVSKMSMFSLPQWVKVYDGKDEMGVPKENGMYTKLAADDFNYISIDTNAADPNYDAVKGEVRKTEGGTEFVKIVWQVIPTDTRIDIEVGYGVQPGFGHGVKPNGNGNGSLFRPAAEIKSDDELVTEYGLEPVKYYAHNYNCFSFQSSVIGFSTAQMG